MKLTGVFVLVLAAGLTVGWIVASGPSDVAEVGSPSPDFSVELIEGGTFTLSDVDGPVVVNFWASWCEPCRTEIPDISTFADANPGVQVIGVAIQDVATNSRAFAEEVAATYPLALGNDDIEDAYPAFGLPFTVIIDGDGDVTHIYNGIVDENVLLDLVQTPA